MEKSSVTAKRIELAQRLFGSNIRSPTQKHLINKGMRFIEGKDYVVLAYTDWGDEFYPTLVKWSSGEVDNLKNKKKTMNISYKIYKNKLKKQGRVLGGLP